MPRPTSPETAEKILQAALKAFSAHGFAGARVADIAKDAGLNKQLIYYYFGKKDELYREVLQLVHRQFEVWIEQSPVDPAENLSYWQRVHAADSTYLKLLMWEGLQPPPGPRLVSEEIRRAFYRKSADHLRSRQGPGGWPERLKAEHALLSWIAVVTAPFAMPHLVKLISGKNAYDSAYLAERDIFLQRFGEILKRVDREGTHPSEKPFNQLSG